MKKLGLLFLTTIMCILIVSCGSDETINDRNSNKNEKNGMYQEDGKYEGWDIDISHLYGEWDGFVWNEKMVREYNDEIFVFNEDGTCVYEDNNYKVKFTKKYSDTDLEFVLLKDKKEIFSFQITYEKFGCEYIIHLYNVDKNGKISYSDEKTFRMQENVDISYAYGKWIDNKGKAEPIIIKEGGYCTVDEKRYIWYLDSMSGNDLINIYLYEEEKRVYDYRDMPKYKIGLIKEEIEGTIEYRIELNEVTEYNGFSVSSIVISDDYRLVEE